MAVCLLAMENARVRFPLPAQNKEVNLSHQEAVEAWSASEEEATTELGWKESRITRAKPVRGLMAAATTIEERRKARTSLVITTV